ANPPEATTRTRQEPPLAPLHFRVRGRSPATRTQPGTARLPARYPRLAARPSPPIAAENALLAAGCPPAVRAKRASATRPHSADGTDPREMRRASPPP